MEFFKFFLPSARAHEAYVLTKEEILEAMKEPLNSFSALSDGHNLNLFITISACISALLFLNFLLMRTPLWGRLNALLERFAFLAPYALRLALSASFFFSALTMNYLGPELSMSEMPFANAVRAVLFAVSAMILAGWRIRLASWIAMGVYLYAVSVFGFYLMTYFNYFGALLAMIIFGSGKPGRFIKFEPYKTVIIRACYAIALLYAALEVKFLHPEVLVSIVEKYNLTQFNWLFPSDPLLIALGMFLGEFAVGIFILLGFQLKFTVLASLVYITLSLIFFREMVWPHFLLYGISLNLLIQPERLALNNLFQKKRD